MSVANVSKIPTTTAREGLTKAEQKIVAKVTKAFEAQLTASIPELLSGLEVSGKQSSLSITTTLKKAKGPNVSIIVSPRVRAARESDEFQVHVTDDRQLELGWVDVDDEDDADADEAFGGED